MKRNIETVKRVIIRGFEMPKCCRECEFEGILNRYDDNLDLHADVCSIPVDSGLPFCILNDENISDDSVRASHCRLKEVEVPTGGVIGPDMKLSITGENDGTATDSQDSSSTRSCDEQKANNISVSVSVNYHYDGRKE